MFYNCIPYRIVKSSFERPFLRRISHDQAIEINRKSHSFKFVHPEKGTYLPLCGVYWKRDKRIYDENTSSRLILKSISSGKTGLYIGNTYSLRQKLEKIHKILDSFAKEESILSVTPFPEAFFKIRANRLRNSSLLNNILIPLNNRGQGGFVSYNRNPIIKRLYLNTVNEYYTSNSSEKSHQEIQNFNSIVLGLDHYQTLKSARSLEQGRVLNALSGNSDASNTIIPLWGSYCPAQEMGEYLYVVKNIILNYQLFKKIPNSETPSVLNIGCGTGALAILLSRLWKYNHEKEISITATDISQISVECTQKNIEALLSKQEVDKIEVVKADLVPENHTKHYDFIVTFPPFIPIKGLDDTSIYDTCGLIVERIFKDAIKYLKSNGKLIFIYPSMADYLNLSNKSIPELGQEAGLILDHVEELSYRVLKNTNYVTLINRFKEQTCVRGFLFSKP